MMSPEQRRLIGDVSMKVGKSAFDNLVDVVSDERGGSFEELGDVVKKRETETREVRGEIRRGIVSGGVRAGEETLRIGGAVARKVEDIDFAEKAVSAGASGLKVASGLGSGVKRHPKKAVVLAAGLGALVAHEDISDVVSDTYEHVVDGVKEVVEGGERGFVERENRMMVSDDGWVCSVESTGVILVGSERGKTVYRLLKDVFETDAEFLKLSENRQALAIDVAIKVVRGLNPSKDLDNFASLVGGELVVPVDFEFTPSFDHVLTKKKGGYGKVMDMAVGDGFDIYKKSQDVIFDETIGQTMRVPGVGEGYWVDREGSEDSVDRLLPDVVEAIEKVGEEFSTLGDDSGVGGWKFVLTDMMRDSEAQTRRKSVKQSTHSTGRSFDVSDGRWVNPDGNVITWSKFSKSGKGLGPSKDARFIDGVLRPAFEDVALANGWVLYKEPGHWHVYIAGAVDVDMSDEWGEYVEDVEAERVEVEEGVEGVEGVGCGTSGRFDSGDVFKGREGALSELSAKISKRLFEKFEKGSYSGEVFILEESTIGKMRDLKGVWKYKLDNKSDPRSRAYVEYVYNNIDGLDGSLSFVDWYVEQEVVQNEMFRNVDVLFSKSDRTHRANKRLNPDYDIKKMKRDESVAMSELVTYISPEVVLSMIQAEFLSELPSDKYIDNLGNMFEGYNIAFGPALNDREFSSGFAQLILGTFKHLNLKYNSRIKSIQEKGGFDSVVVPKNSDKSGVCDAMVLNVDSVIFWSYISIVDHTKGSFVHFMKNEVFNEKWVEASEADKMKFLAVLAPLANHMGAGGIKVIWPRVLREIKDETLNDVARNISGYKMNNSRKRTAMVGYGVMEELIALGEKKIDKEI